MTENELIAQLREEGFSQTYVWDGAHTHYGGHTHAVETAYIILSGELTLTMDGESKTYRAGERCDVPQMRCTRRKWDRAVAAILSASAEPKLLDVNQARNSRLHDREVRSRVALPGRFCVFRFPLAVAASIQGSLLRSRWRAYSWHTPSFRPAVRATLSSV